MKGCLLFVVCVSFLGIPTCDNDGDGIPNSLDNCPGVQNRDQIDSDGDMSGDVCDFCPFDGGNDADFDRICGNMDNCPDIYNPDQLDEDQDGIGSVCDDFPNLPDLSIEKFDVQYPREPRLGDIIQFTPVVYNIGNVDMPSRYLGTVFSVFSPCQTEWVVTEEGEFFLPIGAAIAFPYFYTVDCPENGEYIGYFSISDAQGEGGTAPLYELNYANNTGFIEVYLQLNP